LVANQNRLQKEQEYQETTKVDLADLQDQLTEENSNYAADSSLYQQLK
jgi:hypothetical protein